MSQYSPLSAFRVAYDDGSTQDTNMAAGITLEEARAYFVGQRFEATETTFRTAVSVELLEGGAA